MIHQRQLRVVQLIVALLLVAGVLASAGAGKRAAAAELPPRVEMDADGMPGKTWFPETGHHLSGTLLKAWNRTGLMIFGYPISDPLIENGRTVQYFERARLEVWPEHSGTEWEVQGTLIGNWMAEKRRKEPAFRPLPPGTISDHPDRVIFGETGHSLAFGFKEYWEENGGLWQFGFPISEEFTENGFTVQYFERARFEWHPENAGTPYDVLLGLLGHNLADALKIDKQPVEQAADAVRYDIGLFEHRLPQALRTEGGKWWAKVATDAVSIRSEPRGDATALDVVYNRRPLQIEGIVRGESRDGVDAWYVVNDGQGYVPAVYMDPLVHNTPPATYGGHWVDVNLSQFYAVAYNGSTPAYIAIIAAGRDGKTPLGVFNVMYQVRSEIMDSSTVGIPPGSPGYYYLENVEWTSYFFTGGYAIHGNYWTPEASFGNFTSNGCVGMLNPDAQFVWNWLNVGDVVSVHY